MDAKTLAAELLRMIGGRVPPWPRDSKGLHFTIEGRRGACNVWPHEGPEAIARRVYLSVATLFDPPRGKKPQ